MKIKEVDILYFDIPLKEPFKISIGTMHGANDVLVRIHTDTAIVGLGEACPFSPITGETQEANIAVARNLRGLVLGKDPLAIGSLIREFGAFVRTNPSIVAAFDMALHDILGKASSLPLFRLFGGDRTTLETDITADLDVPEIMAGKAKDFVAKGFKTIKVKVGQDPEMDVARLQAIREAVGYGCSLRIDANQGWTVPQAVEALKRLEKYRIQFVEQPVAAWDTDGMRTVRVKSPIPVMADEALFTPADAIKLIKAEACDYFNIKLMKAGGLLNGLKIAHIAESAGIGCMVGCMLESRLALTAAAHLMAAHRNILFADLDGHTFHTVDPIIGGMTMEGGLINVPEGPGLGLDIDPEFLSKMREA